MISLVLLLGIGATAFAPAAAAAPAAYTPPSGAWARFASDLNSAEGLSTGSGVTIALLSTGVDPAFIGGGKVTTGPNYIFKPQISESLMIGSAFAAFLVGAHGQSAGIAPDARILSLRTEADSQEPGAQAFYSAPGVGVDEQTIQAKAIRYAASHGAKVILTDLSTPSAPISDLTSAVSYAVSRNVVIVTGSFPESGITSLYQYPAGFPGVIGVVQVTLPGGPAPSGTIGAVHNNSVLISAPANAVPASLRFTLQNFGTAMGFVTATVALIKQRYPGMSPALVARALAMSARYHPKGGYSTSAGFGVLDPYDAIIDAGKLNALTATAPAGASGAVATGGHFGTAPGVTSALPPIGRVAYAYWGLIAVGVLLLVSGPALAVRRHRRRSRAGRGGPPQLATPAAGSQYPAQAYPAHAYAAQGYPGQGYPGQGYPAPGYPGQGYPPQGYPPQGYPGQGIPPQGYPRFRPWSIAATRPQRAVPDKKPETPEKPDKPAAAPKGWFDPQ